MQKYDIGSIKIGSSQDLILKQINPGSQVLECGCATGYMTQYMKEKLHARVYIVEYDETAFDIAINYAEDGICADLMGNEWQKKFRGIAFDYILFADVLEHIYDPVSVLRKAVALLKEGGKVLVSLPNVTHNDVLLNLYRDEWKYTPIGLLDETHIRFFGAKNLEPLFQKVNLQIVHQDYIVKDQFDTEQNLSNNLEDGMLVESFRNRIYGNVYQFIIMAQRVDYVLRNEIKSEIRTPKPPEYLAQLYYAGSDRRFTGTNKIVKKYPITGKFREIFDLSELDVCAVRFDPIENYQCIVENLHVSDGTEELHTNPINGRYIGKMILFENTNPQISIQLQENRKHKLEISADVIPIYSTVQKKLLLKTISAYETADTAQQLRHDAEQKMINSQVLLNETKMQLDKTKMQLDETQERLKNTKAKYDRITSSFYWRITKPVRVFVSSLKKICIYRKQSKCVGYIKRSKLFDPVWYLKQNPDVLQSGMKPAKHYYFFGWKEGRNPSELFSTHEYLELHRDVKNANICPLYHYEKDGKFEGRHYRFTTNDEKSNDINKVVDILYKNEHLKSYLKTWIKVRMIPIVQNKIVFATFQDKYVCNPKYICEEILRQKLPLEIVWLYKPDSGMLAEYPKNIHLVKRGSVEAKKEIASAKMLIENGTNLFTKNFPKKKGQINICTWHGSLGFKKIGYDTVQSNASYRSGKMYEKNHDYLITNSKFEEQAFRTAFWPKNTCIMLGHARNDILFIKDPQKIERIRNDVCKYFNIDREYKLLLYAPTFRETMLHSASTYVPQDILDRGIYKLDYTSVRDTLEKRFGGKWIILVRHHFYNALNETLKNMIPDSVVIATEYPDMQRLLVAADIGITDYSSWILDFMLTRKPGFLFTMDLNNYKDKRGIYYPLEEAPFPVAKNNEELKNNIETFDNELYLQKIEIFLKDKGCIEDGHASKRIVTKIKELLDI